MHLQQLLPTLRQRQVLGNFISGTNLTCLSDEDWVKWFTVKGLISLNEEDRDDDEILEALYVIDN